MMKLQQQIQATIYIAVLIAIRIALGKIHHKNGMDLRPCETYQFTSVEKIKAETLWLQRPTIPYTGSPLFIMEIRS